MVRAVLKSYRKNILREMKDNLSRMVSLFGIVALGVMMLTGLMSFAPSMRIAGQKYYVQQNVFDLRVLSTLGLSEENIAAIAAVDGVEAVQPVKYQDVEAQWQGQSETAVVRLQQLPADPGADTAENMNRLVLLSGRMPEAPDECVVHVMGYGDPVEPGTVLTLPEDTEYVSRKQFTVVGTVQDPQHFSTDKESSTAGDGQLDDIVFLPEGSLTTDYYTVCYLKVKNAGLYDNYSDAYQAAVDDTAARVKAISGAQCTARRAELIEDASAELADARAEYNDKKAEADRQFAEAEQQLADAQAQLDSAKAQLDAGEAELAANKKALPDTMQGGADELVSGEQQLLEFEDQLQQIEMLVNLKKVADPLLGYAETALHNAQKALDEAEPADEVRAQEVVHPVDLLVLRPVRGQPLLVAPAGNEPQHHQRNRKDKDNATQCFAGFPQRIAGKQRNQQCHRQEVMLFDARLDGVNVRHFDVFRHVHFVFSHRFLPLCIVWGDCPCLPHCTTARAACQSNHNPPCAARKCVIE